MQISYLTVVVIFGSHDRFLGGDHNRGGAEDLDVGASMLRAIPPLTRRRYGVVVSPRRDQTKEEW